MSSDEPAELLARRALAAALDAEAAGAWHRTLAPSDEQTVDRAIELLRQRSLRCATVDLAVRLLTECAAVGSPDRAQRGTPMTCAPVNSGRTVVTGEPVPTELSWDASADGSGVVVRVCGDVCTWSAPRLLSAISELVLEAGCSVLVLDLSSVGLIDARGVAMIVRLRRCRGLDEVRVESPSAAVRRLLSLTGCA